MVLPPSDSERHFRGAANETKIDYSALNVSSDLRSSRALSSKSGQEIESDTWGFYAYYRLYRASGGGILLDAVPSSRAPAHGAHTVEIRDLERTDADDPLASFSSGALRLRGGELMAFRPRACGTSHPPAG